MRIEQTQNLLQIERDAESDPTLDFKLVNLVKVQLFDSNTVEVNAIKTTTKQTDQQASELTERSVREDRLGETRRERERVKENETAQRMVVSPSNGEEYFAILLHYAKCYMAKW